jgi:hypothetical protein
MTLLYIKFNIYKFIIDLLIYIWYFFNVDNIQLLLYISKLCGSILSHTQYMCERLLVIKRQVLNKKF